MLFKPLSKPLQLQPIAAGSYEIEYNVVLCDTPSSLSGSNTNSHSVQHTWRAPIKQC